MRIKLHNVVRSPAAEPIDGGGAGGGSFIAPASGGSPATGAPASGSPAPAAATQPGSPGAASPAQDPAQSTPSDWKSSLPKELQGDATLSKFTSAEALARSYIDAQKLIGVEKIAKPSASTTPEQWEDIYKKLGRPDTPDKYEIKYKEGTDIDAEFTKAFVVHSHKAGILPQQAQALADWFGEQNIIAQQSAKEEGQKRFQAGAKDLQDTFGKSLDLELARANKVLKEQGGADFLAHIQELGLQGDAKFFKFLAKIGGQMYAEHKFVDGQGQPNGMGPQELDKKIVELQADAAYFDKTHARHKILTQEVEELYKLRYPS